MTELCSKCKANWEAVKECLFSKGLNREQAICIINNCPTCKKHFDYLPPIYSQLEIQSAKGV